MSLKYNFSLIRHDSNDLKQKLLTIPGFTDSTGLMKRNRKWLENISEHFMNNDEKPDELKEFTRKEQSDDYFFIWGLNLPNTKYALVGHTDYWLNRVDYLTIFMAQLVKIEVPEFCITEYHGGCGEGSCKVISCNPPYGHKDIDMLEDERYTTRSFLKRANKETGYPISKCHSFINAQFLMPWEFTVGGLIDDITKEE